MNNSNTITLIITAAGITLALGYVSSFSTSIATELFAVQIQNVKHNSSHKSDSEAPSQTAGSATIKLKTDIVPDSDCGAWPKKSCPNNNQMGFKLYVDKTLRNTITGSADIIDLPVTSGSYGVYFDGPTTIKTTQSGSAPGHWSYNVPVSTSSCEGKISAGQTVNCNLEIHYAWSYD
jgi:hypothetical protein